MQKLLPACRFLSLSTLSALAIVVAIGGALPCFAETESLFNGEDLSGWDGDPKLWTVEDGLIVGTTSDDEPLPYNRFLIYDGDPVEDFRLTVEIRLEGDNNSGIQYRCERRPDLGEHVVSGYQCDMHAFDWANGMLYDEKARGILAKRGQKVVLTADGAQKIVGEPEGGSDELFDPSEWHTYTVTARGNHLVHAIDGVTTVEVFDHHAEERDLKGTLAFQVHRGPAMRVEIRKIELERLEPSGLVSPEETPIPEGAADVNPPKEGGKGKVKAKAKGSGESKKRE